MHGGSNIERLDTARAGSRQLTCFAGRCGPEEDGGAELRQAASLQGLPGMQKCLKTSYTCPNSITLTWDILPRLRADLLRLAS